MCRLFETVCVKNGVLQNIEYHNNRMNFARNHFFEKTRKLVLENEIIVPTEFSDSFYKCRVIYGNDIEQIDFELYTAKKIQQLVIAKFDSIDYSFKFMERSVFQDLKDKFCNQSDDEILIVRNGIITDTSFTNVVFWDGKDWFTPRLPLLKGTCRQRLIAKNVIGERHILLSDIYQQKYKSVRLINAMLDFENAPEIRLENIVGL